ncbi:hypothetical protein FHS96_004949 [Sphingomonas zeicaulis]|uniref:hypothetical protein n=1 Tax=Sphingomonas zeicaulis TaxID=1632740 RepID=UPI003D22B51B
MTMIAWLPPTFVVDQHSANASNNPIRIVIKRGVPCPAAIMIQEYREWCFKARFWIPALAAGIALQLLLWTIIPFFMAGPAALLITRVGPLHRRLEIDGVAADIEVAVRHYGADRDAYTTKKAQARRNYSQFKGMTLDAILRLIASRQKAAAIYVARRESRIAFYRRKLG